MELKFYDREGEEAYILNLPNGWEMHTVDDKLRVVNDKLYHVASGSIAIETTQPSSFQPSSLGKNIELIVDMTDKEIEEAVKMFEKDAAITLSPIQEKEINDTGY